jgi:hypothetical protein
MMISYLFYRHCVIKIKPLILNGKLTFRIYINTVRLLDVHSYATAKRTAVKFIDTVKPELSVPEELV